ncbi:MAG: class I adenylate-forming enzyme family protein [Spirochaetaceae bacterium]
MLFGKKEKDSRESSVAPAADGGSKSSGGAWRLIYNPEGDPADVVAYGAAVAEGRIAGKYQLSTVKVPNTVVVQRSRIPGIIVGADVKVDGAAAAAQGIAIARAPRQGRNAARTVGTINLNELMTRASKSFEAPEVGSDEPAVVLYTSGTTGNPKGVTLTHRNFHFQLNTVVKSLIPFTSEDRVVGVLPMYHVFGLANSLIAAINNGAAIVLIPQYSPANLIAAIAEQKATILPAVPSMYQHLLAAARAKKTEIPKSLRYCVSGGAALPLAILNRFMETFETKILEGYGLTETTSSVCVNGQNGKFKESSIGPPAAGVEMRIVDESGNELPPGEQGEIAIRSETVFPGYWNNPEATDEVLTEEGWFLTGDLGYRDEENFFYVTDRKKDIIITGGYNVSPREVEEVLMAHPRVADAAVVGIRGRRDDAETITAFVVAQEGEELTLQELHHQCELELAAYKRPREIRVVEKLPKSATGKVLRTQLRGEVEDRRLVEREEVKDGAL